MRTPEKNDAARPNHFKSALGGATYVYASWDSVPPGVWSTANHRQIMTAINPLMSGRLSQCQA